MCLGIAGQIVEFVPGESDLATVDVFGVRRAVNIGLVKQEGLAPGDWVLIHVGHAIAKMDEEEARASQAFLQELGDAHINEFMADTESQSNDDTLTSPGAQIKGKDGP